METDLVAGRSCGSCNVCCIVPAIDEPALQKPPGCRCRNALPDGACGIYETRPRTCRTFFCGWRRFAWIGEGLRPDISGVYIWPANDEELVTGPDRIAVMITLLDGESLKAEGLAEAVAAAIAAGFATYLMIPGPPGHTSCGVALNGVVGDAVRRNDKPTILRFLGELRARALAGMAQTQPVALASRGDRSASDPTPG